jgi:hypothetical protein
MARAWDSFDGPVGRLAVHVAPEVSASGPLAAVVVLCHGFPLGADSAESTGDSLPALADRLAAESGRCVVAGCFRGIGPSEGDFSLGGWLDDLRAFVSHGEDLVSGGGVWLVGFGTGGRWRCVWPPAISGSGVWPASGRRPPSPTGPRTSTGCSSSRAVWAWSGPRSYPPDVAAWADGFTALRPDEASAALRRDRSSSSTAPRMTRCPSPMPES